MMIKSPSYSICILVISCLAVVGSAGFRGRITRRGLNYVSEVAVDFLMKYLPQAEIPDINEVVGSMTVLLSNVSIESYNRPTLNIHLIRSNRTKSSYGGLRVTFSRLDPIVNSHMKMTYDWGLFTDTRELPITITTANLTMTLETLIGVDDDGNGFLKGLKCQMEGDVQLSSRAESGIFSSLFDFAMSTLSNYIKTTMFHQACSNITAMINDSMQSSMSAANMSRIRLDDDYLLNLKFTESPSVMDTYGDTCHESLMYLANDRSSSSLFPSPAISTFPQHKMKMIYVFVSDQLVNSAWNAALRNNKLSYIVKSNTSDLPQSLRSYLVTSCNTSALCFGSIHPQLRNAYPQNLSVEVNLEAKPSTERVIRFRGRTIEFQANGTADYFVKTRNSRVLVLSTSMVLNGSVKVRITANRILFNLTKFSLHSNSSRIHFGNVPNTDSIVKAHFTAMSRRILEPYLKDLGSKGYQIPSLPWLRLVKPVLHENRKSDVIAFGTDFAFNVNAIPLNNTTTAAV